MAVICAGAKSILDIPRTLEVLVRINGYTCRSNVLIWCRRPRVSAWRLMETNRTSQLSTLPALV